MCITCMPSAYGGQKKTLNTLETELQIIGNHHVVAEN